MKYTRKMLALLLVLVMTVSVMVPGFAAEAPAAVSILDEMTAPEAAEAAYADDEYVSVIVELASAAVLTFLGERTDLWPKEKRDQVTIFFSRVQFKGSAQWKEEIVFWDSTPLESPEVTFPDGTKGTVRENQDPREVFADWLIRPENHAFNHQIVNRLWFWLTGVGIIDPPDDLRQLYANCEPPAYPGGKNPPVNAALLNILEKKLLDSGYDLKEVIRFILNSRTYQQSSIPCVTENSALSTEDKSLMTETAIKNLALYPVRRLEAEVLQDIFRDLFFLIDSFEVLLCLFSFFFSMI